jgi:hypothetical protein
LQDSDPSWFAGLVLRKNKFDYQLVEWLAERYGPSREPLLLQSEHGWLQLLYEELQRRISIVQAPMRTFWAQQVQAKLEPALTRFAGTSGTEAAEPNEASCHN